MSDREWERSIYQRVSVDAANDMAAYSYPHFRTPRVISVTRGHRPRAFGGRKMFGE